MPMTRQEHKAAIDSILKLVGAENQAAASELLTNISDGFEQVITDLETANANVTTLTDNNEKLRAVNSKLFLRVGEIVQDKPATEPTEPTQPEKIDFNSLFDDKGGLK